MQLRLQKFWPYFLVGFLYLCTSPYHRGLNNPNEMVRVYMSKAMIDDHTMAIDKVVRQWGGVDDKARREGKLYSSKAPLQSLIGAPIYAVAKAFNTDKRIITTWLRTFGSTFFGLGLAFLLLAWCRRRSLELTGDAQAGTGLGLSLALGTMLYPYSLTFTGHILAALTAGGTYLAMIRLLQRQSQNAPWFRVGLLAGLAAGAAPFSEYPAALVAAPILIAGFILMPGWQNRGRLLAALAIGGLPLFGLGLWAHHEAWGAFYKTGYSFLENTAYVQVHGSGFFGVNTPKLDAFWGSTFSPGTGLFFFSPILLVGLFVLVARVFNKSFDDALCVDSRKPDRGLAIAALIGFVAEILFISGHTGWRGGWTVGPRYIIPVVPILAVWLAEGLAHRHLRILVSVGGVLSIVATGFAAALYPHLSDVYTNPLASFVWPSYLRGEFSYGIANSLGLSGGAANLVHLIPLSGALVYVATAGQNMKRTRLGITALGVTLFVGIIAFIPENDPSATMRENERLWGFWEPSRPRVSDKQSVYRARDRWREIQVEALIGPSDKSPKRSVRCRRKPDRCEYGGQAWQHFKPDFLPFDGKHQPVLFIHPITGWTIRARMIVPAQAKSAMLYLGLTDASADSDNRGSVNVRLVGDGKLIQEIELPAERGLKSIPLDFSTAKPKSLSLEFQCERDGARVLGFDLTFFETMTSTRTP